LREINGPRRESIERTFTTTVIFRNQFVASDWLNSVKERMQHVRGAFLKTAP